MADKIEPYIEPLEIDLGWQGVWQVRTGYYNRGRDGIGQKVLAYCASTQNDHGIPVEHYRASVYPKFSESGGRIESCTVLSQYILGGEIGHVPEAEALDLLPVPIRHLLANGEREVANRYGFVLTREAEARLRGNKMWFPEEPTHALESVYPHIVRPYSVPNSGWSISGKVQAGPHYGFWVVATEEETGRSFAARPAGHIEAVRGRRSPKIMNEVVIMEGEIPIDIIDLRAAVPQEVRKRVHAEIAGIAGLAYHTLSDDLSAELLEADVKAKTTNDLFQQLIEGWDSNEQIERPPRAANMVPPAPAVTEALSPETNSTLDELRRANEERIRNHSLTFPPLIIRPPEEGRGGGKKGPAR